MQDKDQDQWASVLLCARADIDPRLVWRTVYVHLSMHATTLTLCIDRIGLCSVLRPRQHSIGYMGDGFYRSKDPTNSIKVLHYAWHWRWHD